MYLKYTPTGYLVISPEDDCHAIVDAMLATEYNEDFCIGLGFSPDFVARLMEAGFLVMSANIGNPETDDIPSYVLLPKLHLERSALFFENLHIKKSIRRHINRYELRPDADFGGIMERCIQKHGDDWLTPPLAAAIKKIREQSNIPAGQLVPTTEARPVSFALYRNGELAAGEFGVVCGKVYTSYSGFYYEDNAGTVQLILAARYLEENGFSFFDLGMPLSYKTDLGAIDICPAEFVRLFRG
ncbi:MAG: GNAT family N-acetyltransferase [Treponema sp.]|nr:GNAT family N-acetyltransferase [Treponema sp.]